MPTHSQPSETAKQKRPKARVLWANYYDDGLPMTHATVKKAEEAGDPSYRLVVAVLPCSTRKQAQQMVRWANLSRAEKLRRMMLTQLPYVGTLTMLLSEGQATAILNLIEST